MERLKRRLGDWTIAEHLCYVALKIVAKFNKNWDRKLIKVTWGKGE